MSRLTIMGHESHDSGDKEPNGQIPGGSQEFYRLRRRLGIAIAALISVIAIGSIGYTVIGGREHGIVDAVYMTVITLTTVGFGEIIDMTNNPAGRIFTVLLLLVGMGIVAYSIPLMAALKCGFPKICMPSSPVRSSMVGFTLTFPSPFTAK